MTCQLSSARRQPPLKVTHGLDIEAHDKEGRVLTAEFPHFYLLNCYTPNVSALPHPWRP